MKRRSVTLILLYAGLTATAAATGEQIVWQFDNLGQIGGFKTEVEGQPQVVPSPVGKALQFDGKDDSVFIAGRPLVGAPHFTIEAIFRPDGGQFEQRFMHIAETDPATGLDTTPAGTQDPHPRFMFELRAVDGNWYLDAFVNSKAGWKVLMFPDKLHSVGRWYAIAQTYDGKTYRSYVDGVLEGEVEAPFVPHGPGHVRIGARMNSVSHFKGSIAQARFTDRALAPDELLKVARQDASAR